MVLQFGLALELFFFGFTGVFPALGFRDFFHAGALVKKQAQHPPAALAEYADEFVNGFVEARDDDYAVIRAAVGGSAARRSGDGERRP